jgi:hypothetical protein
MTLTLCGTHKTQVGIRTAGSGEQLDSRHTPVSIIQLVKLIPLCALSKPDIAVACGLTSNTALPHLIYLAWIPINFFVILVPVNCCLRNFDIEILKAEY